MWSDQLTFHPTFLVARGEAFYVESSATWYLHPYDYLIQIGKGRLPFETRHTVGHREMEHDRRRHR